MLTSCTRDALCGARLHCTAEHLQRTGAFRARVACNAVMALDEAGASYAVRQPQTASDTLCGGLRTALGAPNFAIVRRHVADILTVDDAQITAAMRLSREAGKQIIETASATVLAVLLACPGLFRGRRVGAVPSGANVDLDRLPWQALAP